MPTILKTKNSVTTTVVPTTLQQGELAVNITDKKLWVGNAATTPVQLLGAGVTGDVVGPASSTDNAVARFDGTTGKIIQNSAVTIADTTGDITTAGYLITAAGAVGTPALTTTGDTNTGIFFPAADTIAFTEGGVESMRIDSSGNVGIGTADGGVRLRVRQDSTSTTAVAGMYLRNGSFDTNTQVGVSFINADNFNAKIYSFRSGSSAGNIVFATNNNGGVAESNVIERMRLNSTGALVLAGGTTSADGIGITFPASQSASSDANTLDDYEEGTFTPTAVGGTSAGTTAYAQQTGNYTKVGNIVTVSGYLAVNSMTGTGILRLSLPFTVSNSYNAAGSVQTYNLDWPQAGSLIFWAVAGQAFGRIHVSTDNGADAIVQTENAAWETLFTITYQV